MHETMGHNRVTSRFFTLPSKNSTPPWLLWEGLLIHKELFKKGIVVLKKDDDIGSDDILTHDDEQQIGHSITDTDFPLKDRKLSFRVSINQNQNTSNTGLQQVPDKASTRRVISLLKKLSLSNTNETLLNNNNMVVVNTVRREEVFFPIQLDDAAFYLYPWLSKNDKDFLQPNPFLGFEKFVTAGCIFGPGLKAIDQYGYKLPIIKHDIQFGDKQKIVNIDFHTSKLSPYEQMLFKELEKLAAIINKLSTSEKDKSLLYHLPYYDYVLFGIELFMRDRITLRALNRLIRIIYLRKEQHIEKISSIFNNHNITVEIHSPFESIFASLNDEKFFTAENFLKILGIPSSGINIDMVSNETTKDNEKKLVQDCLKKLTDPQKNTKSYHIWQDFVTITSPENITHLEDLFKIANAVMLAIGSQGKQANRTCSILPVSEKQIQVNYSFYVKHDKKNIYPSIVNFTTLDPLLSYGPNTNGLLFYFDSSEDTISRLIIEKGILEHAQKNIINNATTNRVVTNLEEILTSDQLNVCSVQRYRN